MRRALVLTVLLVALVVLAPTAASAHGGEVQLEVVEAVPADVGSAVTYRVALTYVNDGDGIGGATVTAVARSQGNAAPAVTLDPVGDGVYEGTVSFPSPGRWTVTFASPDPEASVEAAFTVEAPPPPTTAPPTPTSEPAPVTSTEVEPQLADDEESTGDDGPPAGLVAGLIATGVVAVGGGAALLVLRRRSA